MNNVEKKRAFLINFAFVALILALAYVFLKYFFWLTAPFLLSFLFAVVLQKPLRFIDRKTKHKGHGIWSVLLVILSICIIIVPVAFLLAAIIGKITDFVSYIMSQLSDIPTLLATAEQWLLNAIDFLPKHIYESVSVTITEWFTKLQPSASEGMQTASNAVSGINLSSITEKLSSGVSGVYSALKGVPSIVIGLVIGIVAWILFTKDYDYIVGFIKRQLPEGKKNLLSELKQLFSKTVLTMFKAYGIIMLITFSELLIGFTVLRALGIMQNNYFVLIAALIAIFDILPVAGSGGILIPWAVFSLVSGNAKQAIGLIAIYVLITVIRQYIEPKIVGSTLGVHPIITLMGLYFGLKMFGFIGMFLVPLVIMTLKAFNDAGRISLWKNDDTQIRN